MLFVVVVDTGDRLHARIVCGAGDHRVGIGLIPVQDAAHEGRDQEHAGVGAGSRLAESEQQGQVAVDALPLQLFGGADALPGGGGLDQDALAADAGLFIHTDQLARPLHGGVAVERQAGVHLGGNPSRHDGEYLATHIHREAVAAVGQLFLVGTPLGAGPVARCVQQSGVVGQGGGLQQQRGVGGGILRVKAPDGLDIAGVGHHVGHRLELFEFTHAWFSFTPGPAPRPGQ